MFSPIYSSPHPAREEWCRHIGTTAQLSSLFLVDSSPRHSSKDTEKDARSLKVDHHHHFPCRLQPWPFQRRCRHGHIVAEGPTTITTLLINSSPRSTNEDTDADTTLSLNVYRHHHFPHRPQSSPQPRKNDLDTNIVTNIFTTSFFTVSSPRFPREDADVDTDATLPPLSLSTAIEVTYTTLSPKVYHHQHFPGQLPMKIRMYMQTQRCN